MAEAKNLMTRALELAIDVVGKRHHFCAAIFTKVSILHPLELIKELRMLMGAVA